MASTDIQALIDGKPSEDPQAVQRAPSRLSERLEALIEKARNRPMDTISFEVTFGEETAEIIVTEIRGDDWVARTRTNPRPGHTIDAKLSCNSDELVESWPGEAVTVAGDHPTPEQWAQIWQLMDAPSRADVVSALWWMHVGKPMQMLQHLRVERREKGTADG
ncbi:hypothetical protein [Microbacterium imperiale]|uniref:Tail assembly chaperone n=1 Tax=Microbacterium imperiale TaxID=33884 RepID=A0A9W6HGR5_9MICO|nr:hypothetical protein [Microbacterium imperiale]MBP2422066.1 hypothetical protein [Microbacterium imperiale]MDS0200223.1 hypothetical protein [Microbacterium imperiale]BFE39375.1 hypothetical protein GCM10017544_03310 [Microbacterium imperiale]GLJ79758.1 hypothetical protein GCM10017586_14400 [Microbacterium imperiale]